MRYESVHLSEQLKLKIYNIIINTNIKHIYNNTQK